MVRGVRGVTSGRHGLLLVGSRLVIGRSCGLSVAEWFGNAPGDFRRGGCRGHFLRLRASIPDMSRGWVAALCCMLVGLTVGLLIAGRCGGHIKDWGDLATWFGATGTVGALAAVVVQSQRATEQVELMREQQEDAARSQAREVRIVSRVVDEHSHVAKFNVQNHSAHDVTALRIRSPYLRYLGHDQPEKWCFHGMWKSSGSSGVLAFNESLEESIHKQNGTITLRPGESLSVHVMFCNADGTPYEVPAGDSSIARTLDINFVDARGQRWARWAGLEPRRAAPAIHRDPPKPLVEHIVV